MLEPDKPPVELNRLDLKNWTPTSAWLQGLLIGELQKAAGSLHAIIVLDQVDMPETGVVTQKVLAALTSLVDAKPGLLVLADSRRGLRGFPPVIFKMNAAELTALTGARDELSPEQIESAAASLANRNGRNVFVTLAARGILGASPDGQVVYVPALPVRGPIDIVGAGDAVSANLAAAHGCRRRPDANPWNSPMPPLPWSSTNSALPARPAWRRSCRCCPPHSPSLPPPC